MNWLDLIFEASGVVQAVIVLLIMASVVSWAVIFFKWRELSSAEQDSEAFLEVYQRGSWSDAQQAALEFPAAPVSSMFVALNEKLALGNAAGDAARVALAQCVSWAASQELLRLENRLSFLATTGSAAPFIGLFGTVIGIINAFTGIGASGSASLAVVAPGIAEALIATAIGLLAAIPATIFYNLFAAKLRGLSLWAERFETVVVEDASGLEKR